MGTWHYSYGEYQGHTQTYSSTWAFCPPALVLTTMPTTLTQTHRRIAHTATDNSGCQSQPVAHGPASPIALPTTRLRCPRDQAAMCRVQPVPCCPRCPCCSSLPVRSRFSTLRQLPPPLLGNEAYRAQFPLRFRSVAPRCCSSSLAGLPRRYALLSRSRSVGNK